MLTISRIALLFPVYVTLIWFISFIFSKPSPNNPRFIMALFMGAGFITFLSGIGIYAENMLIYRIVYPFVFFTALSLFPLFYIYVYQIVTPEKNFQKIAVSFPACYYTIFTLINSLWLFNEYNRQSVLF
jgi:hypothetical protein